MAVDRSRMARRSSEAVSKSGSFRLSVQQAPAGGHFAKLHEQIQSKLNTLDATKKAKKRASEPPKQSSNSEPLHNGQTTSGRRRTKRSSDGELKETGTGDEIITLEQEILALGGSKEDVDLLEDVQSSSEVEGGEITEKQSSVKRTKTGGLEKGLSNILKEIALANGNTEKHQESESSEENIDSEPHRNGELSSDTTAFQAKLPRDGKSKLLCEARPNWYSIELPQASLQDQTEFSSSSHDIENVHAYAKSLLEKENETFRQQTESSSSHAFYNTIVASGTLSDKISALTLAVQESPVHNVKALENLITLAKKRSRSQAVDVLRALKDLFAQGSVLPSEKRLYAFAANPHVLASFSKTKLWKVGSKFPKGVQEQHLITWAFESWLKEQYFEIIKTLEVWCNDEIEFTKSRALSYVFELLKEKPEQEANLLRLLINKLGDRTKKIASQASYLVMQLLAAHPAMKMVVISAVESDFVFRPGQSWSAKYYAAVTLNQTEILRVEEDVAKKLLDIYFGLFIGLLKPVAGDGDRATVVSTNRGERRRRQSDVHKSRPRPLKGDSQESELREKLTSAVLTGIHRAYPYADKDESHMGTRMNTLFEITHSSNFNTGIQALMLIQQLLISHQASTDRFYRVLYGSLLDARLATSSNQKLYLNLLHRALKADLSAKRIKAFAKRILQILHFHEPPFICGALYLLDDLRKTFPALDGLIDHPEEHGHDEEHFQDVDDYETDPDKPKQPTAHLSIDASQISTNIYDPRKRDPLHTNADNTCVWELLPLLSHFQPTILVNATHILNHTPIPGTPDLSLHTLTHFLDRFVYRNPKLARTGLKGSSIMQPMAAEDPKGVLVSGTNGAKSSTPVNSEAFKNLADTHVRADEVFFHKYFNTLGGKKEKKEAKKAEKRARQDREVQDDEEMEEEGGIVFGSEDEDDVWQAMVDSAPQLEGVDADIDEDLSMSDLESEMNATSDDDPDEGGMDVDLDLDTDVSSSGEDQGEKNETSENEGEADMARDGDVLDDFEQADEDAESAPPTKNRRMRKEIKSLPTFASAADYAHMIDDERGEDAGG